MKAGFSILVVFAIFIAISSADFEECKIVELGKNIPYPGNCAKFISCIGGGVEKNCPPNTHFNAKLEVCDWPERAGCDSNYNDNTHNGGSSSNNDKNNGNGNTGKGVGGNTFTGKVGAQCKYAEFGEDVSYAGKPANSICIDSENNDNTRNGGSSGNSDNNNGDASTGKGDGGNTSNGKVRAECKDAKLGQNVPYPGNNAKFISCIGDGMDMNCAPGTQFNAKLEICDRPTGSDSQNSDSQNNDNTHNGGSSGNSDKNNGDASTGKGDGGNTSNGKVRAECKDAKLGQNVPYPGNNAKFISCIGDGMDMNCAPGTQFNAKLEICDRPTGSDSQNSDSQNNDNTHNGGSSGNSDKNNGDASTGKGDGGNTSNGKVRAECKDAKLGQNVPYPGNNAKFISCIGGGMDMNCAPGTYFNAKLEVCDHNGKGDGGNSSNGVRVECKDAELGQNVPYPGNCAKFISCIEGGVDMNCPPGTHFNAKLEVCDWQERAGCE